MKQFYEGYSSDEFVSPLATQLKTYFLSNYKIEKVSALPTQLEGIKNQLITLSGNLDDHLEISSNTRSVSPDFHPWQKAWCNTYQVLCIILWRPV